jgi:hypothetical protein
MSLTLPHLTLKDTGTTKDYSSGHAQLFLVLFPWTAHNDRYCFLIIPDQRDQTVGTVFYPERPASEVETGVKHNKFREVATDAWVREEMSHDLIHKPGTLRRTILDVPVQGLQENRGASWALETLRVLGSASLNLHAKDSLVARCVHDSGLHDALMTSWLEELQETRVVADAENTRGSGTQSISTEPRGRFLETGWSAEHLFCLDIEREPKRVRIVSKQDIIGEPIEPDPPDSPANSVPRGRAPVMSKSSSGSSKLRKKSRSRTRG